LKVREADDSTGRERADILARVSIESLQLSRMANGDSELESELYVMTIDLSVPDKVMLSLSQMLLAALIITGVNMDRNAPMRHAGYSKFSLELG
jgi:hypothetical protein